MGLGRDEVSVYNQVVRRKKAEVWNPCQDAFFQKIHVPDRKSQK